MRPEEVRAACRLGTVVYSGTVANIEQAQLQIARAVTRRVPLGEVVGPVHDAISRAVFSGVRQSGRLLGTVTSEVLPRAGVGSATKVGATPASNQAMAALNAAVGDRLEMAGDPLAIATAVRVEGRDVELTAPALAQCFPGAGRRIAVFVHGLGETELSWRINAKSTGETYGSRLGDEFGYTPVYVRYNTGRHVSHNGRDLASLLERLVEVWPADGGAGADGGAVDELLLIGHSMGGLVIRSACHYGAVESRAFVPLVRHVFSLGSPHLGAPLARWAHFAGWALGKAKRPLPFGSLLTERSAGIDDLRHGYLTDDDWGSCEDRRCRENHRSDIPLLETAHHYTISACLAESPNSPLGRVVGDLLVQPASAHGRERGEQRIPFLPDMSHEIGRRTHFALLNDRAVYEMISGRLRTGPRPAATAVTARSA